MLRSTLYLATAVILAAPAGATAQSNNCEDAAARVNSATLPRIGTPQWNDWFTLTGCGARGAAVVSAALQSNALRTETELTRLDHLTTLLDGWYHPSLISAYETLLRMPDASHAVRLRAMWLLSGLLAPNVDVAGPLQGYMSARCERYDRMTSLREAPTTMPAAAYDGARDALAFAADDRSAPEYVRTTARCWEGIVANGAQAYNDRRDDRPDDRTVVVEQPVSQTTIVVERPVRVVYECDNRFVFYNDAGYDLAVRYGGYGSNGVLRVSHGGPYVWLAARFGPMRFWVGDEEVWYTSATYRPCGRTRVIYAPVLYPWTGWHIGLGVWMGPRYNPRVYRPVIVNQPRRVPDNRYDPRGGDRGRDDRGRNEPNNGGGDRGGRNEPSGGGGDRGGRRNEPAPQPPSVPRTAVPKSDDDGRRSHGAVPIPRSTESRGNRIDIPQNCCGARGNPPPAAAPSDKGGRAAPKGGEKGGEKGGDNGGGRRAEAWKGRPGK